VLVQTVLAALLYRARTGEGQAVELPLFETLAEYVLSEHLWGRTFDPPLAPMRSLRVMNRWPLETKDGYVCFWFARDEQYARFWDAIGRPDMKTDERFTTRVNRNQHLVELLEMIGPELVKHTTAHWLEAFNRADLPVMPMHTLETLVEDPHLRAVDFLRTVQHPSEGAIVSTAVPSKWSKSKPHNTRHAPLIGEHTLDILTEAGFAASEIDALREAGAVYSAPAR
jgi:crotonobetainyl-CoA:carnitine CoA-transferase CaiB-like acyl-CoA transferase